MTLTLIPFKTMWFVSFYLLFGRMTPSHQAVHLCGRLNLKLSQMLSQFDRIFSEIFSLWPASEALQLRANSLTSKSRPGRWEQTRFGGESLTSVKWRERTPSSREDKYPAGAVWSAEQSLLSANYVWRVCRVKHRRMTLALICSTALPLTLIYPLRTTSVDTSFPLCSTAVEFLPASFIFLGGREISFPATWR